MTGKKNTTKGQDTMTDNIFVPEQEQHNPLATKAEGVQLPFAAPLLYWMNGNPDFEEIGGVRYFGGWALQEEAWRNIEAKCTPLPAYFRLTKFKEYSAYLSRGIAVSPLATRERWLENRSHVQVLGYMATIHEDGLLPYGPVVLSAKSNSARYLRAAFSDFDKATKDVRPDKVPYYRFFIRLGTFGYVPTFVTVGKGRDTHDITPCTVGLPKDGITLEHLKAWYVGADVINACNQLSAQAAEWLNDKAWKSGKKAEAALAPDPAPAPSKFEEDFPSL
jgi:hypothetical protein